MTWDIKSSIECPRWNKKKEKKRESFIVKMERSLQIGGWLNEINKIKINDHNLVFYSQWKGRVEGDWFPGLSEEIPKIPGKLRAPWGWWWWWWVSFGIWMEEESEFSKAFWWVNGWSREMAALRCCCGWWSLWICVGGDDRRERAQSDSLTPILNLS